MIHRVCVVGLGHVGLPTPALLAKHGIAVHGFDVDAEVVATINSGVSSVDETSLQALVSRGVAAGALKAAEAPAAADAFIVCVPTPLNEDHTFDSSHVRSAVLSVAPLLEPNNLVVLESTSPVGTTERACEWLAEVRPDLSFPLRASQDGGAATHFSLRVQDLRDEGRGGGIWKR